MKIDLTSAYAGEQLKAQQALMMVIDPELGINIVDMGLLYDLDFSSANEIKVEMTLSSPYCPMGDSILTGVEKCLQKVFPDCEIIIDLVWQPAWSIDRMSDEGKEQLNIK